jgi:hypothetical protein
VLLEVVEVVSLQHVRDASPSADEEEERPLPGSGFDAAEARQVLARVHGELSGALRIHMGGKSSSAKQRQRSRTYKPWRRD